MVSLIILVVLCIGGFIGWRFYLERQHEKLRDNPPKRRIIEVSLPAGARNSPHEMARFYRKVASAAKGDSKARKVGARQIDFLYLFDVPQPGATPELRCRIYADPDRMEAVKKAVKSVFRGATDVIEIQGDDLVDVAMRLRPRKQEEERASEREE